MIEKGWTTVLRKIGLILDLVFTMKKVRPMGVLTKPSATETIILELG